MHFDALGGCGMNRTGHATKTAFLLPDPKTSQQAYAHLLLYKYGTVGRQWVKNCAFVSMALRYICYRPCASRGANLEVSHKYVTQAQ